MRIYKSNSNTVFSCKYHIVFCPKFRRKVLLNGVDVRFKEIALEVAQGLACEILEMEVMPEHVHLIVEIDPHVGVSTFIRKLKGRTSRLLRSEFPWLKSRIPSLWTSSYFVSTIGGITLDRAKEYVKNQKYV